MPLDNFDLNVVKQVFKQICKDYINHVTHEATTFKGKFGNFFSSSLGYMDSNETRNSVKELVKSIKNLQNADDLIVLALTLGKKAYNAQSNTLSSYSTYSETCYLIAQCIIRLPEIAEAELKFNPSLKIHPSISQLPDKLNCKIKEILHQLEEKKIENTKRVRNGETVEMKACYEYMRQLYYLGHYHLDHDPEYIKTIFPTSHYRWKRPENCKGEINNNYPIVMQRNFAEIQIKRFRLDLEDKIIHEYIRYAMANTIDDTIFDGDAKRLDLKREETEQKKPAINAKSDAKSSVQKEDKSHPSPSSLAYASTPTTGPASLSSAPKSSGVVMESLDKSPNLERNKKPNHSEDDDEPNHSPSLSPK